MVSFCCPQGAKPATCTKSDNMGWRYLYIILGVLCLIMSILRTFALRMTESPKWLISRGRKDEAVASINSISRVNKSEYTMSSSELHESEARSRKNIRTSLCMISNLFRGKRQARSMICLLIIWLLVGIVYPNPAYISSNPVKLMELDTPSTLFSYRIISKPTASNSATEAFTKHTATGQSLR